MIKYLIVLSFIFSFQMSLFSQKIMKNSSLDSIFTRTDSLPLNHQINHSFSKKSPNKNLNKDKFLIVNSNSKKVSFYLSYNKKQWEVFAIQPSENLTINLSNQDFMFFKIYTDKFFRKFTLKGGKRYAIIFDTMSNSYSINSIVFD